MKDVVQTPSIVFGLFSAIIPVYWKATLALTRSTRVGLAIREENRRSTSQAAGHKTPRCEALFSRARPESLSIRKCSASLRFDILFMRTEGFEARYHYAP
jgi:hypothetical protein